jgi:SGNH hydrolase-like domain, acetyltransferase AlgX
MNAQDKIISLKLKRFVFAFFFVILFAPIFQQMFSFVKEKKMEGVDNSAQLPMLAIDLLLEGKFQKNFEDALNINIGFRKTFVRLYNQINYSLFSVSKAEGVVVGENGFIYAPSYISGYVGRDFVGIESITIQLEKAKVIQDELKKRGVDLIFAFAPGKGSLCPEHIPDRFLQNINLDSTNYGCYINTGNEKNLNIVDLRKYLLLAKNKSTHPLFSKVGVHWSDYAAFLAADTIIKKIELLKNIKLIHPAIVKSELRDTLKPADKDVEIMMNLFTDLSFNKMSYFEFGFTKDTSCFRPRVLTIADSYFSTIVATGIVDSVFSDWKYWLYNEYKTSNRSEKEYDFNNDIERYDVVLLLATDATLEPFPYNFINEAYEVYAPKNKAYYILKDKEFRLYIQGALKNIEKIKPWKRQLIKSAKEKKVSFIDECINVTVWLYKEQELKNKYFTHKTKK